MTAPDWLEPSCDIAAPTPISVETARGDIGGAAALDGVRSAQAIQRRERVIASVWATTTVAQSAERRVLTVCGPARRDAP